MNSKLLIFVVLFMMLCSRGISYLEIQIRSIDWSCYHEDGDLEPKLLAVEWLPGWNIKVTVQSPKRDPVCGDLLSFAPAAIGHFSLSDNYGHSYEFGTQQPNADWINGYGFDNTNLENCFQDYVGQNPYNHVVGYPSDVGFAINSTIVVKLTLYYKCNTHHLPGANAVRVTDCNSCDFVTSLNYA